MIFFSCFSDTANSSISAIDSTTTFFQPLIKSFEDNSSLIYLATKAKASFLSKLQEPNKLSFSHKKKAIAFLNISNSFDNKLNLTTTAATTTNNNLTSSVEGVTEAMIQPITSKSTTYSNFTANTSTYYELFNEEKRNRFVIYCTSEIFLSSTVNKASSTTEIITKSSKIGKYFIFNG